MYQFSTPSSNDTENFNEEDYSELENQPFKGQAFWVIDEFSPSLTKRITIPYPLGGASLYHSRSNALKGLLAKRKFELYSLHERLEIKEMAINQLEKMIMDEDYHEFDD